MPQILDNFQHRPLDLTKHQIRLLRLKPWLNPPGLISCEIQIFDLQTFPSYTAISYAWGPLRPVLPIILNGKQFQVPENIWDFFYTTSRGFDSRSQTSPPWMWINALCIDQANGDERNHQVSLMSSISRKASNVTLWLGASSDNTSWYSRLNIDEWDTKAGITVANTALQMPYWNRL